MSPIRNASIAVALWCIAAGAAGEGLRLTAALRSHLLDLPALAGDPLSPGALERKVVVVTFFASWCPPCRDEFAHLNEIAAEFPAESLTVLGLNVFEAFDDQDAVRMARFLNDTAPAFFVSTGGPEIRDAFGGIDRIPTLFVFDRNGEPLMHFVHQRDATKRSATAAEIRAAINSALEE